MRGTVVFLTGTGGSGALPRRPGFPRRVEAALVRAVGGAQFRQELRNLAALLARG